jgi:hypothetical protein
MEVRGLPKEAVKPSTRLETLIPPFQRRKAWAAIGETMGLRMPRLEYSSGSVFAIFLLSLTPSLLLGWKAIPSSGWAAVLFFPLAIMGLLRALKPLAFSLPKQCETAGRAAKTVLGLNHARLRSALGPSRPSELREALKRVVTDLTGAELSWLDGSTKLTELVETTLLRLQV